MNRDATILTMLKKTKNLPLAIVASLRLFERDIQKKIPPPMMGFPGQDGAPGPQGEKGDKGDMGEKGADGINGIDGAPGSDGKDGIDGRDGKDGKDGKAGPKGPKGDRGDSGKDGKDGKDGADGKDGEDGSPDSGADIIKKINSVGTSPKIDASHIKNLSTFIAGAGKKIASFLHLTDTPSSFSGQAGNAVAVKSDESGLEFIAFPAGYTDEEAQDAVGTILTDSTEIDFTYDDATPSITASLKAGSIDETKLDTSVNASLDLADTSLQPAAIGTTVQAYDADLTALAGTASFTSANWTDLTDAGATTLHKHDHGGMDGLSDDDHTIYALLAGRAGGQTLIGGTAAGEDLTLQSTSHATRGQIWFGTKAMFDESVATTGRLVIGNSGVTAASFPLEVIGASAGAATLYLQGGAGKFRCQTDSAAGFQFTWVKARETGTAANTNDVNGDFAFNFYNSSAAEVQAGVIRAFIADATAGSESLGYQFFTKHAGGAITARLRINSDGNVGVGNSISPTAGKLVVQTGTTDAIPTLYLNQQDVSEEMIEFNTTIGVGNAIEAVGAKSLTTTHFIKVTIPGGLTRYIPCGTIA